MEIQAYSYIMWGYFCAGFIDFMLKGKSLLDCTHLFSPNRYEKKWLNNIKIFLLTKKIKMKKNLLCYLR